MPISGQLDPAFDRGDAEFTLIAQGVVDADKRRTITEMLGYLGMECAFTPTSFYEQDRLELAEREPTSYKFADLTDPDDYVVREHIEDLRSLNPHQGKGKVIRAFHSLIDLDRHSQGLHDGTRKVRPRNGVNPVLREEVGIPTYEFELEPHGKAVPLSKYAIRAGDILAAAEHIAKKTKPNKTEILILSIAARLQNQFDD